MKRFLENKYIDAFLKMLLFSAVFHFSLIIVYSISNFSMSQMNYFNVIGLNLFFPELSESFLYKILSCATLIIVYLFFCVKRGKRSLLP